MDKEILNLFKISNLNNVTQYVDYINILSINSINMLIDACSNENELDLILSKYTKHLTPSIFASIIKKFCYFNKIEPAKLYLSSMIYKYAYPTNRHIEPILELLYLDIHNENLDYVIKLFNLYVKYKISVPSNTCIKFMIYFSRHNRELLFNNIEFLQLNFDSSKLNNKYLKYLNEDNSYLDNLQPIDIQYTDKTDLIKKLIRKHQYLYNFSKFIETSDYNVIIDGANLGFYGNTYPLNQNNIDSCLKYYEKLGFKPLIILHKRHQNNFYLMKKWIFNKKIYFTDFGQNDDLYWIIANLKISLNRKVILVTNDKLRDHIFELIGNTSNINTYMDLFIDKYIQNYTINKYDIKNRFSVIPMKTFSNTIYNFGNIIIGFPINNSFYIL